MPGGMGVVVVEDNVGEFIKAKDEAVALALEAMGLQAAGYAQLKCPVDTGLLRNSITYAVSGQNPALDKYSANATHASSDATRRAGTAGKPVDPVRSGSYTESAPGGETAVWIGSNVEYAP